MLFLCSGEKGKDWSEVAERPKMHCEVRRTERDRDESGGRGAITRCEWTSLS